MLRQPAAAARILRGEWGFAGFVVSDCGAIDDILPFHPVPRPGGGFGGRRQVGHRPGAIAGEYSSCRRRSKDGLITEAEIDGGQAPDEDAGFRLGMFDPPEMVKYAAIPFSVNDAPAHQELSLRTARSPSFS